MTAHDCPCPDCTPAPAHAPTYTHTGFEAGAL